MHPLFFTAASVLPAYAWGKKVDLAFQPAQSIFYLWSFLLSIITVSQLIWNRNAAAGRSETHETCAFHRRLLAVLIESKLASD